MDANSSRRVIVVGGGRVGRRVGSRLAAKGHAVTIVERDEGKAAGIEDHLVNRVVVGDGRDPEVLREADPETASFVAGLTNDTETNLAVCERARELAPEARTLLRINEDGQQDYAYLTHVDNVVYPAAAGAAVAVTQMREERPERVTPSGLP